MRTGEDAKDENETKESTYNTQHFSFDKSNLIFNQRKTDVEQCQRNENTTHYERKVFTMFT